MLGKRALGEVVRGGGAADAAVVARFSAADTRSAARVRYLHGVPPADLEASVPCGDVALVATHVPVQNPRYERARAEAV